MQSSNAPNKFIKPFAQGDITRVEIPVTTVDPTRASQTLGFPPLTMQPPEVGGVPPQGEDFNGAMNQVARAAWWVMLGSLFVYDAAFATNVDIGGYPKGSQLLRADLAGLWLNGAENNATDPDNNVGTSANWLPGYTYGAASIAVSTATTIYPVNAAKRTLLLTGVLTANSVVTLPAWIYDWTVIDNTTRAGFTLTVKTAAGTGVVIATGSQQVRGDGANIVQVPQSIAAAVLPTQPATLAQVNAATLIGGQCYMSLVSGNWKLSPYNGNKIVINGAQCTIPAAGVTLAPTGLTANTVYNVYAVATAGVVTSLEASTTGYTVDPATGYPMKTGDLTRAFVGPVFVDTGAVFVDSGNTIGGLSYYNRRPKRRLGAFSTLRSTASVVYVEVNTEIRTRYLNFADSPPAHDLEGGWTLTIGGPAYVAIGVDGTLQNPGGSGLNAVANQTTVAARYMMQTSAEGQLHFATVAAAVPTGGGTVNFTGGTQSGGQRCEIQTEVWG